MTRYNLTRRQMLLGSLGAGAAAIGSSLFAPRGIGGVGRAMADSSSSTRRFVFLYLPGGWDQLLFLDPRSFEFEAGGEADYRAEVTRTGIDTSYLYGGFDNTMDQYGSRLHIPNVSVDPGFHFGPAAITIDDGVPRNDINMVSLVDRGVPMGMIRGINMGTLGHEPGYLYFLTGQPSIGNTARGTSIPIRLAAQLAEEDPALASTLVATTTLGIGSYTGDKPGRLAALQANSVDDLQRILAREADLVQPSPIESALRAYSQRELSERARCYDAEGLLTSLRGSASGVEEMLQGDLAGTFAYLDSNTEEGRSIRARYGIGAGSTGGARRSAHVQAAYAALSVKTGFAQFISASLPAGGDTHNAGNRAHANGLSTAVDAIARLVDDLATSEAPSSLGGNWLDHTTICVFSEFGRTPTFNPVGGRDHHFTNSCLLIGAGVRPGSVAGRSTEVGGMSPVPYDFDLQEALDDDTPMSGRIRHIIPEDIAATLLASAGLFYGEYRDANPLWSVLTADPY